MNKSKKSRALSVYSNLSRRHKTKKDAHAKQKARYLATLPKNPVKRFFYRLHPKRVVAYWFSRQGAMMALKIFGVTAILLALLVGGLFAYFRKDLDAIRPGEINKRVQTTVTKYLDRNGKLLWEDKGDGNYKLVVESDEISDLMKKATIAIEDKEFYSHNGVSISGLMRAVFNNLTGGEVQGGSTLTQQLVKQVFFADEASDQSFGGIPRKIKELILSVEVERMYNKDQILTLYLNESPYGGRRNGVESAAQTYFGKHAKDLNLAEASLLAAIPQNPSVYDPYNPAGHEILIARQHTVLDSMVDQGMISREDADAAKQVPILDKVLPVSTQYEDIRAPHFVQMVRAQLEQELGEATVGRGGLTVTTTLDIRIQNKLEEAMKDMFKSGVPSYAGFSNGAATVEDTETGQIVALMGSRDFEYPGFGQDNAATAYIQPGSTVKPFVYMELFKQKDNGAPNYGSGSILKDENIDAIYGAQLRNADRKFLGNITIRQSLARSRNIPAVKAMYISGVEPTLDFIHEMGGTSYCTQGTETQTGLASAIGGCGIRQVDLVNAYASIAREGVYKPQVSVLEVKNNAGEVLQKWVDDESKRVADPQVGYIVSDILTDDNARAPLAGYRAVGQYIPGVQTATKTGTSDRGGQSKDIWMASYSPALAMAVWLGNSDATLLTNGNSSLGGPIVQKVMEYAHKEIYAKDGRWKSGDWFTRPSGVQTYKGELYPSWWKKDQGQTETKLTFDRLSKYRATECTPEDAKIELTVTKIKDPVTKKDVYTSPSGYDANKEDDKHNCNDTKPTVSVTVVPNGPNSYKITATPTRGKFSVTSTDIVVNGTVVSTQNNSGAHEYIYTVPASATSPQSVSAIVRDSGYYRANSNTGTIPAYVP